MNAEKKRKRNLCLTAIVVAASAFLFYVLGEHVYFDRISCANASAGNFAHVVEYYLNENENDVPPDEIWFSGECHGKTTTIYANEYLSEPAEVQDLISVDEATVYFTVVVVNRKATEAWYSEKAPLTDAQLHPYQNRDPFWRHLLFFDSLIGYRDFTTDTPAVTTY